jgi:adenylate cyclase
MDLPDHLLPFVEALVGRFELTSAEVAREAGVDLDHARRLWRALGFPPVADDAKLFARSDVAILTAIRELLARHQIEPSALVQLTRLTGRSLAQIADAQLGVTDRWLPEGAPGPAAVASFVEELEQMLSYAWRRHLLAALLRRAVTPTSAEASIAVGFADLVGFTTLSQMLDATELAALVDRFEAIAYEHIPERGGRVVKMIGDEVMFSADDGVAAVEIGLALANAHTRDPDLPEVRVGLARGPTVAWDGDLFGPTVNLAARLVNVARPGTVLVDDGLGEALVDVPGFALRHLRPVRLQGIGRVRSWVVRRAKER